MLVAAGDNIYRFSLQPLWEQFLDSRSHWIVALPETDPARLRRTGILEFGKNDCVLRLHEKPSVPPSTWSCPAIYFLQASAVSVLHEFLRVSENTDAPGYFIDFLCRNERVRAFRVASSRFDIGSIDDYHRADTVLQKEPVILK
jgi:glucose-1-phosphate thymidylyltransferase